jgi:gamma-glutamyltranspeptidase/glutathione hydrolase
MKLNYSHLILFVILTISITITSCLSEKTITGAVVSAREEASSIGVAIMERGGSAFDAMIATDLALTVCFPNAGNISGGGFMVYRTANGEKGSIDYREKAPSGASVDMYLDNEGNVIDGKSTIGGLAVGVPGTVAGLVAIHEKFGTLPWEDLVQPAIDLASNGYLVTNKQENSFNSKIKEFIAVNGPDTFYAQGFKSGDRVKNLALANTLKRIAKYGKSGFYEGPNADNLVERVKETGGIITHDDLLAYRPVWRDVISFRYKDLTVNSMGPPSSGGICLGQILKMIEPYDVGQYEHNSEKAMQIIVEAERRSYADRSFYLGDPDFYKVPSKNLLDQDYLNERMKSFDFGKPLNQLILIQELCPLMKVRKQHTTLL